MNSKDFGFHNRFGLSMVQRALGDNDEMAQMLFGINDEVSQIIKRIGLTEIENSERQGINLFVPRYGNNAEFWDHVITGLTVNDPSLIASVRDQAILLAADDLHRK
ncbi:MAG: hypothetical protein AMS22_15665 [Thiotrichales bacterium SG8_50]|nr:MAG: hypothetical protein AMS22_15665 [Thiotrichales bacterium SG8_50]